MNEREICTKAWQRRGIKVNKHRNRDHRYGAGKVHWLRYIPKAGPENINGFGYWVKLCDLMDKSSHVLGGVVGGVGNVAKYEPVTCKICLNLKDLL